MHLVCTLLIENYFNFLRLFMKPPLKISFLNKHENSVPLPAIQSETWLVHAKVREPHTNPQVRMNCVPLALVFKGEARNVHMNQGVPLWFTNFRVNQPCFRLDCRESYRT